ncbi:MAG: hypothetical protein IPP22_12295 [Nitrosomonas sp.]|nr:hypothetical protein [Nitrosomonas sp.]
MTDLAVSIPNLSDPKIQNENSKTLESSSTIRLSKQAITQSAKTLLLQMAQLEFRKLPAFQNAN